LRGIYNPGHFISNWGETSSQRLSLRLKFFVLLP